MAKGDEKYQNNEQRQHCNNRINLLTLHTHVIEREKKHTHTHMNLDTWKRIATTKMFGLIHIIVRTSSILHEIYLTK